MRKEIIFFLAVILSPAVASDALAATLRVPEDYKKIQEAIETARGGDTITVGPGVYNENLLIKKPLSLKASSGPDATAVEAAVKGEPAITVADTDGVTISGLTARGSTVAGITLRNVAGSRIEGAMATKNESGILLYSSQGNTLAGNFFERNETYGIYLEASHGNTLKGNSASLNGDKGIFLSSSNGNTLTENSVNLNTWNGIVLLSSHKNVVKGNKALRNTYGIVATDSDDSELADNSIWPNLVIILPVILIYIGIASYIIQRIIFRAIYRG